MTRTLTGVVLDPKEFRKMNECVSCGKATNIKYGEMCERCKALNYKYCDMCDKPLRNGVYEFFTYDIREDHRNGFDFKVSKEVVREFSYKEVFNNPENTANLCSSCVGWEARVKHKCFQCEEDFENTKSNYKQNGNMCPKCSEPYNQIYT